MRNPRLGLLLLSTLVACKEPASLPDDGTGGDGGAADGGGADTGPTDSGPSDSGAGDDAPDWCGVRETLVDRCASCHSAAGGWDLALELDGDAWARLIDQPADIWSDWVYVSPGDHARSLLWAKVAGAQGEAGEAMPLGEDPLSAEQLGQLAAWIDAGAAWQECGDDDPGSGGDGGGEDGGVEDGGSSDGGSSDGGSADGGSADGGSADGGVEDGGVEDGGVEDGGVEDGGGDDGGGPWDLAVSGTGWTSHSGQVLYVHLVRQSDSVVIDATSMTISGDTLSFGFSAVLEAGESYWLDYFADQDRDGACDDVPTDHVFHLDLGLATGPISATAVHSGSFLDSTGCDTF